MLNKWYLKFNDLSKKISSNKFFEKYFVKNLAITSSWIIILLVISVNINSHNWKNTISSDVKGYYTYLPSVFIYNDLKLDYINKNIDKFKDKIWFRITPDRNRVIQFTYGLSFLYVPFFLIAHLFSIIFDYDTSGYSDIYSGFLLISCIFYFAIGLIFFRKLLLKYFNQKITTITLISIVLGTNLFYYVTKEATMSHAYSFSLFAIFLYLLEAWLINPKIVLSIYLGFVSGLIILIRPSNGLIILLFFIWNVGSWKMLLSRLFFLTRNYYHILIIICINILIWLPQLLYWKHITGHYFYFSYGENQGFFFNDPEIINVLFSYRKGWLLYTPLMLFSIIGIPFLINKYPGKALPVCVYTVFNIYVISSWCQWWYGGSFGSRPFIESYVLLAISFAAFINWVGKRSLYLKIPVFLIILMLIFFNQFQIKQYLNGAIHYANMTKEAYWETFGKTKPTSKFYNFLEEPNYRELKRKVLKAKGKLNNEN